MAAKKDGSIGIRCRLARIVNAPMLTPSIRETQQVVRIAIGIAGNVRLRQYAGIYCPKRSRKWPQRRKKNQ